MDDAAKRGEDISKHALSETVRQTVTVPEAKDPRLGRKNIFLFYLIELCYSML